MFATILFYSCETAICDCEYVSYENGKESYRSSWDASCEDEVLSTSTYTHYDGSTTRTVTKIECD